MVRDLASHWAAMARIAAQCDSELMPTAEEIRATVLIPSTAPMYWFERQTGGLGPITNQGTCVFLEYEGISFGITAAHVWRAAEAQRSPYEVFLSDNDFSVDRLHWVSDRSDLAVFEMMPGECEAIEKKALPSRYMPVTEVAARDLLIPCGYPAGIRGIEGRRVDWNMYIAWGVEARVPRHDELSFQIPLDSLGTGSEGVVPPDSQSNFGGISGGPVFSVQDQQLRLVGIIKEGSWKYVLFFVCPTHEFLPRAAREILDQRGGSQKCILPKS